MLRPRPNGQDAETPLAERIRFAPLEGIGRSLGESSQSPATLRRPTHTGALVQSEDLRRAMEESLSPFRWAKADEFLREAKEAGFKIFTTQSGSENPFRADRIVGPVQFVSKLFQSWNLDLAQATRLLGYEPGDQPTVAAILAGRTSLRGADVKARIAALFRIKALASGLFREGEQAWMRTPRLELGNRAPLDMLLEGSMENLLALRQYVEHISGL